MKENPVKKCILLVEDRIGEILESGRLKVELDDNGIISMRHAEAVGKHRFLKRLSKDLHKFYMGSY